VSAGMPHNLNTRLRCSSTGIAVSLLFALAVFPARADIIVFDEASGPLTVYGSSRLTTIDCFATTSGPPATSCEIVLSAPNGARLVGAVGFFPSADAQGVREPDPGPLTEDGFLHQQSDLIPGQTSVPMEFLDWLTPMTGPFVCPDGCPIVEDGTFQTIGTIKWSDGTVDTIQFHGEVPEPSSLALLATSLIGIGLAVKRKAMGHSAIQRLVNYRKGLEFLRKVR